MGTAVTHRLCVFALLCMFSAPRSVAADTYALIVSGASGGPAYAAKYDGWRNSLAATLKSTFGYPDDRVVALGEARKEQVLRALAELRTRLMTDDVLLVMLIGHGTDEKFNLAGPDMTAGEWASQLKSISARVVFVDMTSASFPFFRQLAAPGRVVVTATDSTAQQFETVFPEFFIKAFTEPAADADKDGRVSIYEAFQYADANVRTWFDQHNQLPTERAVIDEEAVARATFLQPRAVAANDAVAKRQADLENAIASLKARRQSMPAGAYDAELERLLTEFARLRLK